MLEAAHQAWTAMADFRSRRHRYLRYTYGDQWGDVVVTAGGRALTEGNQMREAGANPLTNNLIRRMVKAVVGRYRRIVESDNNNTEPAVSRWLSENSANELDARTFEEFLISGAAIQRVGTDNPFGAGRVEIDIIDPDTFFVNSMRDIRGRDLELVGCLRQMSLAELCIRFGEGNPRRVTALKELYMNLSAAGNQGSQPTFCESMPDFFHAPPGRCRVVEVWTLECREMLRVHDPLLATMTLHNPQNEGALQKLARRRRRHSLPVPVWRWEATTTWHCRMMAPDGTVLSEFDSAAAGGSHPFAVKLYPLVDGNVHSLVEDVIDQQRHVNRLITIMDRMTSTAAKGVLLFPAKCKIDGMDWEEVRLHWSDPGGVLPYRPTDNAEPHQVVTPVADMGINQLHKTQIDMFQEVSGVSDTLMGKNVSAAVGVDRYNLEVENSGVAVNDLLKTFRHFVAMRDALISKSI